MTPFLRAAGHLSQCLVGSGPPFPTLNAIHARGLEE